VSVTFTETSWFHDLSPFGSATFVICVHDFPRGEVSVKVGVMEFGLKRVQDDPFSALDLPTGAHIFEDGILHFCLLKRKRTVIVVTHELHFLPFAHAVSCSFYVKVKGKGRQFV